MDKQNNSKYTVSGTNIEEVKRKNAASGLSYNEVKTLLAKNYLEANKTVGVEGKEFPQS